MAQRRQMADMPFLILTRGLLRLRKTVSSRVYYRISSDADWPQQHRVARHGMDIISDIDLVQSCLNMFYCRLLKESSMAGMKFIKIMIMSNILRLQLFTATDSRPVCTRYVANGQHRCGAVRYVLASLCVRIAHERHDFRDWCQKVGCDKVCLQGPQPAGRCSRLQTTCYSTVHSQGYSC